MTAQMPHGTIAGVLFVAGLVMLAAGAALMANEVGGMVLGGVILATGAIDVVLAVWFRGKSAT